MALKKVSWILSIVLLTPLVGVAGIVDDVRGALEEQKISAAETALHAYRSRQGVTPEYVEALLPVTSGRYAGVCRGAFVDGSFVLG